VAHVTLAEVQQWLEQTKLQINQIDAEFEATATALVFGQLDRRYATAGWTDVSTTPELIRKIIAMLVSCWTYERQYSEVSPEGSAYSRSLEDSAMQIVQSLMEGTMTIPGVLPLDEPLYAPLFEPNDSTALTQQFDQLGNPIGEPGDEDIKFTMARRF
jgi:hypothetical protein